MKTFVNILFLFIHLNCLGQNTIKVVKPINLSFDTTNLAYGNYFVNIKSAKIYQVYSDSTFSSFPTKLNTFKNEKSKIVTILKDENIELGFSYKAKYTKKFFFDKDLKGLHPIVSYKIYWYKKSASNWQLIKEEKEYQLHLNNEDYFYDDYGFSSQLTVQWKKHTISLTALRYYIPIK